MGERNSRALALYFPTYAYPFSINFSICAVYAAAKAGRGPSCSLYSSTVFWLHCNCPGIAGHLPSKGDPSPICSLYGASCHSGYDSLVSLRRFRALCVIPNDSISKCSSPLTLSPRDNVSFRRSLSSYPSTVHHPPETRQRRDWLT
ncbi:hypothetical protein EVAR_46063_1 [Eumeta japonica]|uniref:Uncharacterized protein n=1 Tax=Eumeta variegata TaxID=151549 RepID=A0A4C1SM29_EUMVA|nr:hypothetical protein EVAR_46063_1 [Eumeta japonica]